MPWGLLPLVRLVSSSWTADLGLSALEGPGKASGGLVGSRQANEPAPQGWPCTRHPAAGAGGWRASVSDGAPGAGHRPSPPIHDRQALLYRQALLIAQPIPLASSPSQRRRRHPDVALWLRASSLVSRSFSHNASEPCLLIQNHLGNFPNRMMSRPRAKALVSSV